MLLVMTEHPSHIRFFRMDVTTKESFILISLITFEMLLKYCLKQAEDLP